MENKKLLTIVTSIKPHNYVKEVFNSYVLPWNCHNLNEKQTYIYTHRYRATLGFNYSHVSVGFQKPDLNERASSGVGFFSFFGETGWFVHSGADARAANMSLNIKKFTQKKTDNGFFYRIYSGFFYNGFSSYQDQLNNFQPHYSTYVFASLVNDDRGVGSYLEQTYCRDMKDAAWDTVRFSPLAPRVFGLKPCNRTDSMLSFFSSKIQTPFLKLNFFSFINSDYKSEEAPMLGAWLSSRRFFTKVVRDVDDQSLVIWDNAIKGQLARRAKGLPTVYIPHIPFHAAVVGAGWCYNSVKKISTRRFLINKFYDFPTKLANHFFHWYNRKKRRRRFFRRFIYNKSVFNKYIKFSKFYYDNQFLHLSPINRLAFKKTLFYRGKFNKRKKRKEREVWYSLGALPYRAPENFYKAVRYSKGYKKRKFVVVF